MTMNKWMPVTLCALLFLSACNGQEQEVQQDEGPVVIDFPTKGSDTASASSASDAQRTMTKTAALEQDCQTLTAKSDQEKTDILADIAHNMDEGALDMILGAECAFLGGLQRVTEITDDALKLMPADNETLYFNPSTNHYFVTYTSADTIAYVVEKKNADMSPEAYFNANKSEFTNAATRAKAMLKQMEGDDDDTDESESAAASAPSNFDARYAAYIDGVVGNGEQSVLFFHANWCPQCQENDRLLGKIYDDRRANRSTYKINYDGAGQLRQAFGVTQQDTFILIDGSGKEIDRATFPTVEKLEQLVAVR